MTTSTIGKGEGSTQQRIIKLFTEKLGYSYLGNWKDQERTGPVEASLLEDYLVNTAGYSSALAHKAIARLTEASGNLSHGLTEANRRVYEALRYGLNVREQLGQHKETVYLIDWKNPQNNHFAIAEEVTVLGKNSKRPDIVLYLNGIAVGVLELKRSKVGLEEGIRQNLDNQLDDFVPKFFTAMQLVMAGNDTQGLRYGTFETPEKYYLEWKEDADQEFDYKLDKHLYLLCGKDRLLELIHDFVVYDKGVKKVCRPNQFFGVKAAQQNVRDHKGGILWHTQGSGKSLSMLWLTKWIIGNVDHGRVLIITDREELDDQIEGLFLGVNENIYRTKSGRDLINVIDRSDQAIVCSLVHKFGKKDQEGDFDKYIKELEESVGRDFTPKGKIHVFVDECHRTQSGKLHRAMKTILPDALFIGFTGTPLLKKNKQKSIEVFGPYIGEPYKYDEAVSDGVVLDLLYEARDVRQFISDQQSIDEWFDAETKGLTPAAKTELKKKWGTMKKVLSSQSRLDRIVTDITKDFKVKPRLSTGEGNAILVVDNISQACKIYKRFQDTGFKECAIITSYEPNIADIKGETTGEAGHTEKKFKYEVYEQMLNGRSTEEFEAEVKDLFKKQPAKMKLLIVVDKLLTGFDAPPATYLYIDKKMQDHGLFQAICRVNRIHTDDKEHGYIVDYRDLFESLKDSINDYTSGAFDEYDAEDVQGMLKNRLDDVRSRLETSLEVLRAMCEPVHPQTEPEFIKYFCGDTEEPKALKATEERRVALYKAVVRLIRAYANAANEMHKLGYTSFEAEAIKEEVKLFEDLRETIKIASGDKVDLKRFEPGMRQLLDMYLDANASKKISDFENDSLVDLISRLTVNEEKPKMKSREAVAETIENNVRSVIIERSNTNPKYYEKMSRLLQELVEQRKQEAIAYAEYLKRMKKLAEMSENTGSDHTYPESLDTKAKQALYDNLNENEALALALDAVIHATRMDGWHHGGLKEKKLSKAVEALLKDKELTETLMDIIREQDEYK